MKQIAIAGAYIALRSTCFIPSHQIFAAPELQGLRQTLAALEQHLSYQHQQALVDFHIISQPDATPTNYFVCLSVRLSVRLSSLSTDSVCSVRPSDQSQFASRRPKHYYMRRRNITLYHYHL